MSGGAPRLWDRRDREDHEAGEPEDPGLGMTVRMRWVWRVRAGPQHPRALMDRDGSDGQAICAPVPSAAPYSADVTPWLCPLASSPHAGTSTGARGTRPW